jgi:antitoxin PrlF
VTIPAKARQVLKLSVGDKIEFVEIAQGQFAIMAATRSIRKPDGLFKGRHEKPVSIAEINAAIRRRAGVSK